MKYIRRFGSVVNLTAPDYLRTHVWFSEGSVLAEVSLG